MKNTPRFRRPAEMPTEEKRVPVSTRIKGSTKAVLEREAKKHGMSVATLMANVLDDYVAWRNLQALRAAANGTRATRRPAARTRPKAAKKKTTARRRVAR